MKLRPRLLVMALLVAVPSAVALYVVNDRLRERDMRIMLDRFVTSQLTDDTRERCDANANWFLAGPRPDRPAPEVLAAPDADVYAPRPPTQDLPLEHFAFDGGFQPLSTAGPRFPPDLRQALRSGQTSVIAPFETEEGTGLQRAVVTDWSGSPCAVLLFRMRPLPNEGARAVGMFVAIAGVLIAVALIPALPIVSRVRTLGGEARRAAADEYRSTVTVGGRDEMSSIAFAFNEAASDIRRRATAVRDRDESLRRHIAAVGDVVAGPLVELERELAELDRQHPPESLRAGINAAIVDAHTLAMRLQNVSVAAALKMSLESRARDVVDLGALVQRSVDRHAPFALAMNVQVGVALPPEPIATAADAPLLEQAINNLVDNAIRHNRPGGRVEITLDRTRDGRFSLRVADDGPGAPDEVLSKLNAPRRFRGDEGRVRQPGELGLGLAVVREVGDRLGITWAFRRSAKGWFEAELTGTPGARPS
jgi:signal transduction histidine kinase